MPLYYMHSKVFHPLFKSLIDKSNKIQEVRLYYYNFLINKEA